MSAGGQRGIDTSGITGLRLQYASDVTHRTYLQEVYQNFNVTTANARRNQTPNGTGYFLDFLQGRKEVGRFSSDISASDCSSCPGLPYQSSTPFTFRF